MINTKGSYFHQEQNAHPIKFTSYLNFIMIQIISCLNICMFFISDRGIWTPEIQCQTSRLPRTLGHTDREMPTSQIMKSSVSVTKTLSDFDTSSLGFVQQGPCTCLAPCKMQVQNKPTAREGVPAKPPANEKCCDFAHFTLQKQQLNLRFAFMNILCQSLKPFSTKYLIFSVFQNLAKKLELFLKNFHKKFLKAKLLERS